MELRASIDLLYQRVGRHLNPKLNKNRADMRGGLPIRPGVCQRTRLRGEVVDYPEAQHGIVIIPTLAKLLWLFVHQEFADKDGVIKPMRLGGSANQVLVLTERSVITNLRFGVKIPKLVFKDFGSIIEEIAKGTITDYLFLSFSKSISRVLADNLRWTHGPMLQVNGDIKVGAKPMSNCALDLRRPLVFARSGIDPDQLAKLFRIIIRDERSELEQTKLVKLVEELQAPKSLLQAMRGGSWDDIGLTRILHSVSQSNSAPQPSSVAA